MQGEIKLLQAIERYERAGSMAGLANALDHLAEYYHKRQRYKDAAPIYARALGLWRQILGPTHPSVGILLVNLGQIFVGLHKFEDAESFYLQALSVFEKDLDFEDHTAVEILDEFAQKLRAQGQSEKAEQINIRIKRIAHRMLAVVKA